MRAIAINGNNIQQSIFIVWLICSTVSQETCVAKGIKEDYGALIVAKTGTEIRQSRICIVIVNLNAAAGKLFS